MADIDIAKPNPKKEKFAHISTSFENKTQPILGLVSN